MCWVSTCVSASKRKKPELIIELFPQRTHRVAIILETVDYV